QKVRHKENEKTKDPEPYGGVREDFQERRGECDRREVKNLTRLFHPPAQEGVAKRAEDNHQNEQSIGFLVQRFSHACPRYHSMNATVYSTESCLTHFWLSGTSSPPEMSYSTPRQRMLVRRKLASHIANAAASHNGIRGSSFQNRRCFRPWTPTIQVIRTRK